MCTKIKSDETKLSQMRHCLPLVVLKSFSILIWVGRASNFVRGVEKPNKSQCTEDSEVSRHVRMCSCLRMRVHAWMCEYMCMCVMCVSGVSCLSSPIHASPQTPQFILDTYAPSWRPKRSKFRGSYVQHGWGWMCWLIWPWLLFHNVYVYQIITLCVSNICNHCQWNTYKK